MTLRKYTLVLLKQQVKMIVKTMIALLFCSICFLLVIATIQMSQDKKEQSAQLHVGYVAQEEQIVEITLESLSQMESVNGFCDFRRYQNEDVVRDAFSAKEIQIAILFPENIYHKINTCQDVNIQIFITPQLLFVQDKFLQLANAAKDLVITTDAVMIAAQSTLPDFDLETERFTDDLSRRLLLAQPLSYTLRILSF